MNHSSPAPSEPPWALEVRGLTKTFGRRWALRGVDLKVREGTFLSIFGPNGAGKSTLIRILATLSKPTAGEILFGGLDLKDDPVAVRRHLGVVTHQILLYGDLTAYENLRFYGRLYEVPKAEARIEEMASLVGLQERLHDRVRSLSRGMQQRLSIARALLHDPRFLLLDEPETGLDQASLEMLSQVLRHSAQGQRTIIMTTHNLPRGLELGDEVAILAEGRIVYHEERTEKDIEAFAGTYARYTKGRR